MSETRAMAQASVEPVLSLKVLYECWIEGCQNTFFEPSAGEPRAGSFSFPLSVLVTRLGLSKGTLPTRRQILKNQICRTHAMNGRCSNMELYPTSRTLHLVEQLVARRERLKAEKQRREEEEAMSYREREDQRAAEVQERIEQFGVEGNRTRPTPAAAEPVRLFCTERTKIGKQKRVHRHEPKAFRDPDAKNYGQYVVVQKNKNKKGEKDAQKSKKKGK